MQALATLAWPLTAMIIAVVFMFVFRKPIGGSIHRIKSINKSGIKMANDPEAQKEIVKTDMVDALLKEAGDSFMMRKKSDAIKEDLKSRGIYAEMDAVDVLIKYLAQAQTILLLERIHDVIFGSQIFLLRRLNESRSAGLDNQAIKLHFSNVQEKYTDFYEQWDVKNYLAFLVEAGLIEIRDHNCHIGQFGVEYLIWLTDMGKSEIRPF